MEPCGPALEDATCDMTSPLAAVEPRAVFPRGAAIGRYVILDCIGEGGMGVVYKAYDPELERPVALKFLHAGGGGDSSTAAGRHERLLREAKALARLAHPNVLAIFDVGPFESDVFLATEFVEGPTLRAWLRETKRSRAEILRAFLAAGEGLAAAHEAGLVHRDFKPDNVIVGNDGRVRVLDFGVARIDVREDGTVVAPASHRDDAIAPADPARTTEPRGLLTARERTSIPRERFSATTLPEGTGPSNRHSSTLTEDGQLVGTPRYMAPEQHLGEIASARADQFAFGISLYEALYGETPFEGASTTYVEHVVLGRVRPAPPGSDVPRWLRQVLLRALAAEPLDRHASMAVLLEDLRRDRTVARRRALAVVATLIVFAVAGLAYRREARGASLVCRGAERKLSGVWDDARKREVQRAFDATGSPLARDAFVRMEAALDAYTRGWSSMHVESCEATRVRGEQSEELLDLRMECLAGRLEEVRAQVDVFARADVHAVEKAVQAARALPRLDACADAPALRAPLRPPADASTRARVGGVRRALAEARALQRTGKYGDALAVATRAETEAASLAYRPAEAEADYLVGDLQDDLGDYHASELTLERAAAAATAGRHDTVATRALAAIVVEVGLHGARFAEAHAWALVAEGAAERSATDAQARGEVPRNLGRVLLREGKLDESRVAIERCLATWRPVFGPDDLILAGPLTDLGNVHLEQGALPAAIARYRESLAILEKALGREHPMLGPNLNNLGDAYSRRGEYAEAEESLTRALAVWETALGPEHPKVGMAVQNLAQVARARGDLDRAHAYAERAIAIYTKTLPPGHPDIADGHDGLAAVLRSEGKLDRARAEGELARAMLEKLLGPDHPHVAEVLQGIGETRLLQGAPADAVVALEHAHAILEADAGDAFELAETRFSLARALGAAHRDAVRARTLASEARTSFVAADSPLGKERVGAVDAWLANTP
jgi:serine/threonine protein kinase/tetratricopeptide (TPR) repeat protein